MSDPPFWHRLWFGFTAAFHQTAHNSAADPQALAAGPFWWPVGVTLVIVYCAVLLRFHRGRVSTRAMEPPRSANCAMTGAYRRRPRFAQNAPNGSRSAP